RVHTTAARLKHPMNIYGSFAFDCVTACVGNVGGVDFGSLVLMEQSLKFPPGLFAVLTLARYPGWGQCMVGSLTGTDTSQSVTEEFEGTLETDGNRPDSAMA